MDSEQKRAIHRQKVEAIAASVKEHAANAKPGQFFSLKKASVSHTVPQPNNPKKQDQKIDIGDLREIIEIDVQNKICIAESGISFSSLVEETLKVGLVPMTVSELKGITIGGAVAGCSVESMSYKYGGFHDSCLEYEVVSGTGAILTCTRENNAEIFEMIHGSFGTLGILTLIKFQLIPAKPFVRMDYVKYESFSALMTAVQEHYEKKDIEFMDAIVHSPTECVLCIGTFEDEAPYHNTYWFKIFYQSTKKRKRDFLRTADYFFRYDTECHWLTRGYHFENFLLRATLGWLVLGSSNILKFADRFPGLVKREHGPDVIVDVFIPAQNVRKFWEWYVKVFNYFPLWVVPYKIAKRYPWINIDLMKEIQGELFLDLAIYGFQQKGDMNYYKVLEEKVAELGGIKTLITHNYYTEKEFWESYNKTMWEKVKKLTDPQDLFRNLFEKMVYKK